MSFRELHLFEVDGAFEIIERRWTITCEMDGVWRLYENPIPFSGAVKRYLDSYTTLQAAYADAVNIK